MRDNNSLNRVILLGRLGQKPEIRVLPQTGRSVANFTVATNEKIFNKGTGETKDRTEWHRIVVWGKLAEFCEKYLTQGKQVYIEGKLRTRPWQDKEGVNRKTTEIEAQTIILLGRREGAPEEEAVRPGPAVTDFPSEGEIDQPAGGEGEDDIPF